MTAFKRRDKVLLFRLTQDEYNLLLAACAERGGRTLSEFARTELLQRLEDDQQDTEIEGHLYRVNERLNQLQSAVQDVTGMLEAIVKNRPQQ
ncbi:MAG: hypothetical protein JJE04_03285 [Acidobacteriia bacterium]|nr:hypothetical protein [Terriglobia bacterium]